MPNSISGTVRELRKRTNKTLMQVASDLQISYGAYQKYESGAVDVSTDMLCKLADYFNVTTDYLLGREPQDRSAPILSQEESELVDKYRSIGAANRELLSDIADAVVKVDKKG